MPHKYNVLSVLMLCESGLPKEFPNEIVKKSDASKVDYCLIKPDELSKAVCIVFGMPAILIGSGERMLLLSALDLEKQ